MLSKKSKPANPKLRRNRSDAVRRVGQKLLRQKVMLKKVIRTQLQRRQLNNLKNPRSILLESVFEKSVYREFEQIVSKSHYCFGNCRL